MSTYKETLYFIGKCLTINHEEKNRFLVEKDLKPETVDWDAVVKVSTTHYVFPALYCNLKRANLLHYIPTDLVAYMKHITDLNRERNQQIIKQAKEVNELLLENNIKPIFLKGTGNLLEGLYDDIAERMVGDIDLLVSKKEIEKSYKILQESGYENVVSILLEDHRHLPRITHSKKIAAIELHHEILKLEKSSFFNFDTINSSLKFNHKNKFIFLSDENQIKLTIFSKMINDNQYFLKTVNLRAAYDFYLISNRLSKSIILKDKKLSKELNAGIELYSYILSKPKMINNNSDKKSKLFLKDCLNNLNTTKKNTLINKKNKFILKSKSRLNIIFKSLYKKSYFKYVIKKLTDVNFLKRALGIKGNI